MGVLPTNSCVTHEFNLHGALKIHVAPYPVSSGALMSYSEILRV